MFDLELIPDHAALFRKAIAAVQHFGLDFLEVDVFSDDLIVAALIGERGNDPKVLALLQITANLIEDDEDGNGNDVYLYLRCQHPIAFKVNLGRFLRNLAIVGDGQRLSLSKVSETTENLFFAASDLESNLLRYSEMQMDEDYKDALLKKPEQYQKYKAIIGIPAERFIEVVIHLHHFGDSVSVCATDTEVKFTTVNKEIVFRKQLLETVECVIGGIEPAHPISFVFTLHVLRVIINACKLSKFVWLLHSDGSSTMLNCPLSTLGNLMLYL